MNTSSYDFDAQQLLQWHIDAGVDEAIDNETADHFTQKNVEFNVQVAEKKTAASKTTPSTIVNPPPRTSDSPLHHTPSIAAATARTLADQAQTLEELEANVRAFNGCAIKKTANKTVFCDGNPSTKVMIIGEAPGAQEDSQGIPFCGPSGKLLDRMFAAIGLNRTSVYISNTVFWRPPGNRQPSIEETTICLPFVEKHIALVNPSLLVLCGGTATTTLLRKDASISRLRGKLYEYNNCYLKTPISSIVTFHPSYLLRSPLQKALAWNDLIMVQDFIRTH